MALNDNDADDGLDLTSIIVTSGPSNGGVVVNPDGTVDYTHNGSETISDIFTYTIKDLSGAVSNEATVNITVTPVNDDPVAADDSANTLVDTPIDIPVLDNDNDVDGGPLTVTAVTDPANGSVIINPDGTIEYTPDLGFFGTDTFIYAIFDGAGGNDTATVTVTVLQLTITIDSFMTDSKFAGINSFDVVFTKDKSSGTHKIRATNPGTYFYNTIITNTGLTDITADLTLDIPPSIVTPTSPDGPVLSESFCLKAANPVHVYSDLLREVDVTSSATLTPAQPITATTQSLTCVDVVDTSFTIPAGELRYVAIHLGFNGKGEIGFADDVKDTYLQGFNLAKTTLIDGTDSIQDNTPFVGTGKKITAIGGLVLKDDGNFKMGLRVEVDGTAFLDETPVTPPDGFYFIQVPENGDPYQLTLLNVVDTTIGQATVDTIEKDQYVPVDFLDISSADPVVYGWVFDESQGVGLADVQVDIFREVGPNLKLWASTTTQSGGYYAIAFFQPGDYFIDVVPPEGLVVTDAAPIKVGLDQFDEKQVNFHLDVAVEESSGGGGGPPEGKGGGNNK